MAQHPEIQEKLHREIGDVCIRENGEITYEAINSMEYLTMVFNETLRLYPACPFLDREVTLKQKYIDMPKGMPVYIPVAGLHRDPKYFPSPLTFHPERFSPGNKANIVSGTYMPFGLGGRICIGERLGLLQEKVGLFHILKNHYVKPNTRTVYPIKLNKKSLIPQADGGIYLDIVKA